MALSNENNTMSYIKLTAFVVLNFPHGKINLRDSTTDFSDDHRLNPNF
jgi:hypothetical protein